jgi:hypothetical protein
MRGLSRGRAPYGHEKLYCPALLARSSSHKRQRRIAERGKEPASRRRAIREQGGLRRKPGGAPCGKDANPLGGSRPLRRLGPFREQGEDRTWSALTGVVMRRVWHGETKGKSTAIQSGSSQAESAAGAERMTRKNDLGGPSPRGRYVATSHLRRPPPHWGRERVPDGWMAPSAPFASDLKIPSLVWREQGEVKGEAGRGQPPRLSCQAPRFARQAGCQGEKPHGGVRLPHVPTGQSGGAAPRATAAKHQYGRQGRKPPTQAFRRRLYQGEFAPIPRRCFSGRSEDAGGKARLLRLEARSPKRRGVRRVTSPQHTIHLAFPPGIQLASRIV